MKVLIIGGVAAGMSAASKIKRNNPAAEVVVVEKTGEVSYGACGLPYYISGVNQNQDLLRIKTVDQFINDNIDLRIFHEALSVNTDEKCVEIKDLNNDKTYHESYEKLIIASGASPIVPNIKGTDLANVYTLKKIEEAEQIKENLKAEEVKNVVIIGAGLIGMELVETMVLLEKNVRVIELLDRVMSTFDQEITEKVEEEVKAHGVMLNLKEKVLELSGSERVEKVITDKGEYPADLVVFSIGVSPNVAFLEGSGIELNERKAVKVDAKMRTNIDNVYAAGDCATVFHKVLKKHVNIPLGTLANKQGKILAENISGKNISFEGVLGSGAAKVLNLEVGKTGITELEAQRENLNYGTVVVDAPDCAPYYPNPTDIRIKLVFDKDTKVVLGAQLVGEKGAAIRTNVFAACIDNEMKAEDIAYLDLIYAPPFSTVWDSISIAAGFIK